MIWIYLLINGASFILYGLDKKRAIKGSYRISEKTLLIHSLLGPIGAYFGMRFFRHKTKKVAFRYLIPIFIILHGLLLFKLFLPFY